jgi:1,4-alpha-glucan branching enzyme
VGHRKEVTTLTAPSNRPGMGSIPYDSGVTFRVWAPNATAVSVRLNPGGAGEQLVALGAQSGGLWSADVDAVWSGTQYRYRIVGPNGDLLDRIDPWARQVVSAAENAIVYDETAFPWTAEDYRSAVWDDLVIYELHVGTFDRRPGELSGTLDEVASKLPYLADLGVSAVELLPIGQYPEVSSWGYDPADPFAVDADLGGPDAFKGFVQAAHDAGMGVILDVVYNHMGDQDNALWEFDGWERNGLGGIYFYQDYRHSTPWGERPDYGRDEVRGYLRDNAVDWLTAYRADGLRFDATAYIHRTDGNDQEPSQDIPDGWRLLSEINNAIDAVQPWKITIAEDLRNNAAITTPTGSGGAGFDSQWDPDFVTQLRSALTPADDTQRSMMAVARALGHGYGSMTSRVVYTESHDVVHDQGRLPVAIDGSDPESYWSKKRSALGAAILFTSPGIPMLFMGQEFLANSAFQLETQPLDWAQRAANAGLRRLHRDLIALRRNRANTTAGLCGPNLAVHHVNDTDKVIGYHRWANGGPSDDVIVLANFANRTYNAYILGVPRAGPWRVRFCSDDRSYDGSFGGTCPGGVDADERERDGLPASITVPLGPYTALILSQDA